MARSKQVQVSDLEGYWAKSTLVAEHGKGVNKTLELSVSPTQNIIHYNVYSDKKFVDVRFTLAEALDLYNGV